MKRLSVAMILAAALTLNARQAIAQISIARLDVTTAATMGSVTITGTGFDPANAAISVVVSPRAGLAATVPAYFADATSLRFLVPPLVERTTSALIDLPLV